MISGIAESAMEEAALTWFAELGYADLHGPATAPDEPAAEQNDYREVRLQGRLHDALLPKLLSGEIRLKHAERYAEEAV